MVKAIIFDYGGTIDSRAEHWSEVIFRGWKAADLDIDKPLFRDCYVYGERFIEAHPEVIKPSDDYYTTMLVKIRAELQCLEEKTGEKLPDLEAAAQTAAKYCDEFAAICVDEAKPTLKALAEKYPLALVSNFYGNVESVITAYGIRQLFQFVIDSANVKVRKPDPRIFSIAIERFGLPPAEVLIVGDSLKNDILPADALGSPSVWIKGKGWTDKDDSITHDPTIKTLPQLLTLL
ncbi:MAG: HAD family hydrolase [Clostridium sp.]|nr:HAD family hydrolase [Clostridium sp.]